MCHPKILPSEAEIPGVMIKPNSFVVTVSPRFGGVQYRPQLSGNGHLLNNISKNTGGGD